MTLQTVMLAIMIGVALMLTAGIAYAIARWLDKDELPAEPDHEEGMYLAHKLWCDALDEAALEGDAEKWDRIKAIGWRKYSAAALLEQP